MADFTWRTESDGPAPTAMSPVGDSLTADEALKRVRRGEVLLYEGDFHNARQLLGAMGRRLAKSKPVAKTALEAFRIERRSRALEYETLGRVVVKLDPSYRLSLKRAPEVRVACEQAWGSAGGRDTVVAFKTLLGVLGAAEWRKKGLEVPGLKRPIAPHYGVYVPTRTEYVELVRQLGHVEGASVFDVGTGTGVLGLVLLAKGAASVVATDVDPRAVACAKDNVQRFGETKYFTVLERELFPEGKADLVVCNPPWVPEPPKTRVDRAVFDEGGAMLEAFLSGVREHLTPKGRAVLILSNLAELLGLRPPGFLEEAFARHGLRVIRTHQARPKHGKAKDVEDPLHAARSKEVTTLYELG